MPPVISFIISNIKKHDPNGSNIADIGSGYGFLLFRLAKAFPDRRIYGYEISFVPYLLSQFIKMAFRFKNVAIIRGDAFKDIETQKAVFSSAIAYFFSQPAMQKRLEHLATHHVENIMIINAYPLNLPLYEESGKLDVFGSKVYIYKMPPSPLAGEGKNCPGFPPPNFRRG